MVDCMKRDRPAVLFVDVLFSPLHMRTLAQTIIAAVDQGLRGTYNLGCREGASKRDFAHLIARHLGLSPASLTDGRSTEIAGRTIRPRDLRLDVSRLEAALGRRMPTLSEEVARL
jgi:dTDP-4-dehydrorhamnose reductase